MGQLSPHGGYWFLLVIMILVLDSINTLRLYSLFIITNYNVQYLL